MNLSQKTLLCFVCFPFLLLSQANNEFYNKGSLVHIQAGAEVHVLGDVHNYESTGQLENYGLLVVQGDMYSDNLFQQRGTGTTRMRNNLVNIGQTQFISGSYAVRGAGSANIGVNDGSFYNLELANDQGIVWLQTSPFAGNTPYVADVRGTVDFSGTGAPVVNRIITHDPAILPTNGDGYAAVFGIMNSTAGLGSMLDNTVTTNGNSSSIDNGYVQGKLRRVINPAGGTYGFVLGLEPAGANMQRGMQYTHLVFGANTYDVLTGHFMTGLDNTVAGFVMDCNGFEINYFGGFDHGQWVFEDASGSGAGNYEIRVWPQDDNFPPHTVWLITKDNQILGTVDDCGPTPVGLDRAGFNGFSQFGLAASSDFFLPAELLQIWAESKSDHIEVNWNVGSEHNLNYYSLERSEDGQNFSPIATIQAFGNSTTTLSYSHDDHEVAREQDYYYRYRSVDFDGYEEFSPIVHGRLSALNDFTIDLYPNPAMQDLTIYLESDQDREISIGLYDNMGKLIANQPALIQKGSNAIPVNVEQLSGGMYTFRFEDALNNAIITKRFIKN